MSTNNDTVKQYGYACMNCRTYGQWNEDGTVILCPCSNCARLGDPTKPIDSFDNEWNWKWNGKECWGSQEQCPLSSNDMYWIAYSRMKERGLTRQEAADVFLAPVLREKFMSFEDSEFETL